MDHHVEIAKRQLRLTILSFQQAALRRPEEPAIKRLAYHLAKAEEEAAQLPVREDSAPQPSP